MKVRLGFAATLLYILLLAGNMVAQAPQTEQMMDKKRQHIVEIAVLTAKGDLDINTKVSLGATEWYNPVTNEEYNDYKE